ncbi:MAG: PEGA domain-containing protein, partial [Treponema sp.]|nr:PEGA domain-containing protein [Treponema sp.]
MSEKSAARRGNPPQNTLLQPDDKVKLKPVLGIRPGVYLSILYSIALLVILFFLLIFPGIHKPGSLIILKTEPAGAALRVDGVYMGTSGDKIFVPKGTHTLEAVIPGFENESAVIEIPGRVFGSLLFPRRFEAAFTLKTADPAAVFSQAAADYAGWSFAGEPTAV